MNIWTVIKDFFDPNEEEQKAPALGCYYSCKVVSRDTWEQHEVGDTFDGFEVVEGFYDRKEQNWVLVVLVCE